MKSVPWLAAIALLAASLAAVAQAGTSHTPPKYHRPPDQTFLTFPEWYLVFSPAEYAEFLQHQSPDRFPYFGDIGQFWSSYAAVSRAISRRAYPFNLGYHVMIVVIGTSTTIEYSVKAAYGTLFGRLAMLTRTHGMTDEEKFGARVAQDYVDFIRVHPWYEYDFAHQLIRLWTQTSFFGPDMIRKWERKYALTTEYATKALYAWIITRATRAAYNVASPVTALVIDRLPYDSTGPLPDMHVLKVFADGSALVTVPRYDRFMNYAERLANAGVGFREIAGNRGPILLTVLAAADWQTRDPDCAVLFMQPILTQPGRERFALVTRVADLSSVLAKLQKRPVQVEHVFDY